VADGAGSEDQGSDGTKLPTVELIRWLFQSTSGYSAYRLNERPLGFELDGVYYRIYALEDQWYSPGAQYFKVRAAGKRFILRYDQADDEWTLQSAYDGVELFSRSNVRMITIDSTMVRAAEKLIESCGHCNPKGAAIPFDNILDRVTGSDPSVTDYVLEQPAKCPNCRREIFEKTLIEPAVMVLRYT